MKMKMRITAMIFLFIACCMADVGFASEQGFGTKLPTKQEIQEWDAKIRAMEKLSDDELVKLLGQGFNKEKFKDLFFQSPLKTFDLATPCVVNGTVMAAGGILEERILERNDVIYTTGLLRKALEYGNWQEFCSVAEHAARCDPSEKQLEVLLHAYHMEQDEETREAVLLAIELYVRWLKTNKPLTKLVLVYMAEIVTQEPSQRCLTQWARIYAAIINHIAYGGKKDKDGYFFRPMNTLLNRFEKERSIRDKVKPSDPGFHPRDFEWFKED